MYSLRPNGVCQRSGSPSGGSHLMVSEPNSESIEEHQLPMIIPLLRSRTRTVVRFSGFLPFSLCLCCFSSERGYSLAWSVRPPDTAAGGETGTAGQGRTPGFGDGGRARLFS